MSLSVRNKQLRRGSSNSNIISLISIRNRVKNLYQSTYRVQCAIPSTFSITTINIIIIMITITITTNIIIITTININMSLKQGVLQLAEFSVHHPQDSGSEASLQGLRFKIDRHYPRKLPFVQCPTGRVFHYRVGYWKKIWVAGRVWVGKEC